MALPVLVIVGRPNVGKSSLFNRILGKSRAIVEDIPGVTRDRNYSDAEWEGKAFVVVDTGGFFAEAEPDVEGQIREQALFAIEEADLVVHLLDASAGLMPADIELAKHIRASGKKTLYCVNKIDGPAKEPLVSEFYGLGSSDIVGVSARTGYDFDEFMDTAVSMLPSAQPEPRDYPKVAVIGRPNVGKSTLINSLLGKKRMIVGVTAGTTRDSVDSIASYHGSKYLFIDTAGIRRKARAYPLERFAMIRAMRSIERCDVAVLVLDATEGIVSDDQKIAGMIERFDKGAVILLNKWDLVDSPDEKRKQLLAEIDRKLWFMSHAPMLTVSGKDRTRTTKVFPAIDGVMRERVKRVETRELAQLLKELEPITSRGGRVKLDHMAQVGVEPPRFVIFTNKPDKLRDSHLRFIERLLRERYSFSGTPIRIHRKLKAGARS